MLNDDQILENIRFLTHRRRALLNNQFIGLGKQILIFDFFNHALPFFNNLIYF